MEEHENLNRGIRAVNLWGYDQGWNEDMMVGGRYHNGNMAYHENYPQGEFLALGGGEAATGYVNYNDENETIHSDIGGYVLPEDLSGNPTYFSVNMSPNESYWNNGSSRIMFDNDYFNIAWLGKDNSLYRSTNGGGSFSLFHTFGINPENDVLWIEQSYINPDYIYLHQAVGNSSKLWRTTDHGTTWEEVNLPSTLRDMNFTLGTASEHEIWISFYYGGNTNKVYHTTDGGLNWDNWSTSTLNGLEPWAIAHQYGTDGGVYLAIKNGLVFYRNNSMEDWVSYSVGLPASSEPLRIVPFYKGGVIRLATWNLGVWEAPLFETSPLMADFAAEYNSFFCPGDPIHFVDHSVCGPNATYSWSFPGAIPSTSDEKNPTVEYEQDGVYDVTMTITENGNSITVTKTAYISSYSSEGGDFVEDFEMGGFPESWKLVGNGSWNVTDDASAYATGTYSMRFDNYYYDAQGDRDDVWLGKTPYAESMTISFDAAYTPYNETNTWTEVYVVGGQSISQQDFNGDFFVPTADQWMNHEVTFPVNGVEGDQVIIAFQNRGRYGNALYVDNINLQSTVSVDEAVTKPNINLYPNPAEDYIHLSLQQINGDIITLRIVDMTGRVVYTEQFSRAERIEKRLNLETLASGTYQVVLSTENWEESRPIVLR
jgi:PKD repeat protein